MRAGATGAGTMGGGTMGAGLDPLRIALDQLPHKIVLKDRHSTFLYVNALMAEDLGIDPADVVGRTDFDFSPPDLAERYRQDDRRVIDGGETLTVEEPWVRGDKRAWLRTTKAPLRDATGAITNILVMIEDITERHWAEAVASNYVWALEAVRACDHAVVHAGEEDALIASVSRAITDQDLYVLAYVARAERDPERSVTILAPSGAAIGYLEGLVITWADTGYGIGPTGTAIRDGTIQINNDAHGNLAFAPWRARAEGFGIRSSIALPIRVEGAVFGALTIYARAPNAFLDREVRLFQSIADNLGYGLTERRQRSAIETARRQREAQRERIERSFEETLAAVSATLEQRDPYTSGHDRRVAELAEAIALELGLDADQARSVKLAGIVHDIGKIRVPAEILAKPGRLTPIEFAIMKLHAQAGYDILKTVSFPWPIAEIVRQHHEYLDGSGYPRGLSGDEILLEARILTVADIVESMSSDRPYRPMLGLDDALAEIRRQSGTRLDPRVVDGALAVVARGGFAPAPLSDRDVDPLDLA